MKRILSLAIAILVLIPLLSACSIRLKTPEDIRDNPSETLSKRHTLHASTESFCFLFRLRTCI